jgi:hypothetical protein
MMFQGERKSSMNHKTKETDDSPSFDTAIRGPFQDQWWKAMYNGLVTIMVNFDCWDYVKRMPDMNVLPSTWAFKLKRYPDGCVKKFKARFCAPSDRQKEGTDYFETWDPVIQWSTVRIVMILAIKLKLISVQCNITATFVYGRVPPTESILSISHVDSIVEKVMRSSASKELSMVSNNLIAIFSILD